MRSHNFIVMHAVESRFWRSYDRQLKARPDGKYNKLGVSMLINITVNQLRESIRWKYTRIAPNE